MEWLIYYIKEDQVSIANFVHLSTKILTYRRYREYTSGYNAITIGIHKIKKICGLA
jgi:hypothetical protein